jgi:hypothetical protein
MLACYVLGEFGFPNLSDKRLCIECFDLKCIKVQFSHFSYRCTVHFEGSLGIA